MNYRWDLDELKKLRNKLNKGIKYYNKTNNSNQCEELSIEKDAIDEQIKILKKNRELTSEDFFTFCKYVDKNNILPSYIYEDYNNINNFYIKMFESISNIWLRHDFDGYEIPENLNISDSELVDMSLEFYKNLPTKNKMFFEDALIYTNPSNKQLMIMPKTNEENIEVGTTYYHTYPIYKPYPIIYRTNSVCDFATLNHELNHCILGNPKYNFINRKKFNELDEVEGYFFNYLSYKYVNDGNLDLYNYQDFLTSYYALVDYYVTVEAVKLYKDKKYISHKELFKKVNKYNLYDSCEEIYLDAIANCYPTDKMCQVFALLVTLDLAAIDKKDPEFAFRCFENILSGDDPDIYQCLKKNHVTFMDDGFKNLKKSIKKYEFK